MMSQCVNKFLHQQLEQNYKGFLNIEYLTDLPY